MKIRKTACFILSAVLMTGQVYCSIPENTVIIGDRAYDLKYIFQNQHYDELSTQINNTSKEDIYYKLNGVERWLNNLQPLTQDEKNDINSRNPRVVYKDVYGAISRYSYIGGEYQKETAGANNPPIAQEVTIAGTPHVGMTLAGNYKYYDEENDSEGATICKWIRVLSDGTKHEITGANSRTYTLTNEDIGCKILFQVTPVANVGSLMGISVNSVPTTEVVENQSPTVSNVSISGIGHVGSKLTANYSYSDAENDVESGSIYKWYSYNADGTGETLIAGANQKEYIIKDGDINKQIRFEVTPVAMTGNNSKALPVKSNAVSIIGGNETPVAQNVSISGTVAVGETLTGVYQYSDGENDPQGNSTYQWYIMDTNGVEQKITGETSNTYVIKNEDLNKTIRFEVTPIAASGTRVGKAASSQYTKPVKPNDAPTATNVSVSGVTHVGAVVTAKYQYFDTEGDPQGGNNIFKWYRVNADGTNQTEILGAIAMSYVVTPDDLGKKLICEVTPTANIGTRKGIPAKSSASDVITENTPPYADKLNISGIMSVGGVLTANYTYTDQEQDVQGQSIFAWYREDIDGTNRTVIPNAVSNTYTLTIFDLGKRILFDLIPVANTGNTTGQKVTSEATTAIAPNSAPTATNPRINGVLATGETLTGAYSYSDIEKDAEGASTFKWYRIDPNTNQETLIQGATKTTYTLTADDLGKQIAFGVIPASGNGMIGQEAKTLPSNIVADNMMPIAINVTTSGVNNVGAVMTGNYTYTDTENDPEGGSVYKWYRQAFDGSNRVEIPNSNTRSYSITSDDAGKQLIFEVTPGASRGTTLGKAVQSKPTAVINPNNAPEAQKAYITGNNSIGSLITANYTYYDYENDPQGQTTFKWFRKNPDGSNRTEIIGANDKTYTVTLQDLGKVVEFEVTPMALNGTSPGKTVVSSATKVIVDNLPPSALNVNVTGITHVGETLTGVYSFFDTEKDAEAASTYKWYRADADGKNPQVIQGENTKYYTLKDADLEKTIIFEVTPVANTGTTVGDTVMSTSTQIVAPNEAPRARNIVVSGPLSVGGLLSGTFSYIDTENDPQGASAYQWYRADLDGNNEVAISGATTTKYKLTDDDLNKTIRFGVVPVASIGEAKGIEVQSDNSEIVQPNKAPMALNVKVIGTPHEGAALKASYTYYDVENDTPDYPKYKWYTVDKDGNNLTQISGETYDTYVVKASDTNKKIICEVTPAALTGTLTGLPVTSSPTDIVTGNEVPYATNVKIAGILAVDETLTGNYTFVDPESDSQGVTTFKWYRMEPDGTQKQLIDGQNKSTYTLTQNDVGKKIVFEVTPVAATGNLSNGVAVSSAGTDTIVQNDAPSALNVSVTGVLEAGSKLTGNYGYSDKENDPQGTPIFKWYRIDSDGTNKVQTSEVSKIYTLSSADIGKKIQFEVTPVATRGNLTGSPVTASTIDVVNGNSKPVALSVNVSGVTHVGATLTGNYIYSDSGNDPQGASIYKWYRYDADGTNQVLIQGANTKTYKVVQADFGKKLQFEVTPVAQVGDTTGIAVKSDMTDVIAPNSGPTAVNVVIKGVTHANAQLTGSYTIVDAENDSIGTPVFKWYSSDANDTEGKNKVLINGANSATYKVTLQDINRLIWFEISVKASTGTIDGDTILSQPVLIGSGNDVPTATNMKTTGITHVGATLTGNYTYSDVESDPQGVSQFKWYRTDKDGNNEEEITGATMKTYVLQNEDLGKKIIFEVIPVANAGNRTGLPYRADPTEAITENLAPVANSLSISGIVHVGETLTGNYGYSDVENDPQGNTTYKWYRSDGTNDTIIDGANQKTYVLTQADLGKSIIFSVTPIAATGEQVGNEIRSSRVGPILDNQAPTASNLVIYGVNTTDGLPHVGATLRVGYTYKDDEGDPQGTPIIKWYRADESADGTVMNESEIQGIPDPRQYVVSPEDLGKSLEYEVTPVATRGKLVGEAVMSYLSYPAVPNAAPIIYNKPTISGATKVGSTLTGIYTYMDSENDRQGTSLYKWYRATPDGSTVTEITGENKNQYQLKASDLGYTIIFEVTPIALTGTIQGEAVKSDPTAVIDSLLPVVINVNTSGIPDVGAKLTGNYSYQDTAEGEGTSIYKWYRVDADGTNETEISGETTRNYVIKPEDLGKNIIFEITPVTKSGIKGVAVRANAIGLIVPNAAPTVTNLKISGTPHVGATLTGSYTYTDLEQDADASVYNWYRINPADNSETVISSAYGSKTYKLTADDLNMKVVFRVTPSSKTGTAVGTVTSSPLTEIITPNKAPVAQNVNISGFAHEAETLTGNYNYVDEENDVQGSSLFKWYRVDPVTLNEEEITGQNKNTYILTSDDIGKTIKFEVTPIAKTGELNGSTVKSFSTEVVIQNTAPKVVGTPYTQGTTVVGQNLSAVCKTSDDDNDPITNTYKWYRVNTSDNLETVIDGAVSSSYKLTDADVNYKIFFEVTPKSTRGVLQGDTVRSELSTVVTK